MNPKASKIIGIVLISLGLLLAIIGLIGFIIGFVNNIISPLIMLNVIGMPMAIVGVFILRNSLLKPHFNKYIICSCGAKNDKKSKYCSQCAKELYIKCKTCNNLIPIDMKDCQYCKFIDFKKTN